MAVSDTASSASMASCLIVTLVTAMSDERDDGGVGDGGWTDEIAGDERRLLGTSGGSFFTLTRTTGSFTCSPSLPSCALPPLLPCSSCILSASTSLCFCLSILVSSSICLSFSCSILSLSTGVTVAAEVVKTAAGTRQCFCRGMGLMEN